MRSNQIIMRITTVLVVYLFSLSINLFGQKMPEKVETPSECEFVRQAIDNALIEKINVSKDEESYIIFIFRKGKNEKSKSINLERMNEIKKFLNFRAPTFDKFVMAERKENSGSGKVEIYVNGRLMYELYAKKNKTFGSECSE